MSRCRADSFYVSPTDKRSFDQWDVFAVLPNGDKVPITHRKDVRRLELNHPGWNGQALVVSKADDTIAQPVMMNANTIEGKRLLDTKAAAKMALSLADPSQKGEIGLTAKQVAHGLFGDPAAGGAGTAPVVKMVGQLMTQTDNWAASVEMLSFVSGASTLLDPGRTQQLLEFCTQHTQRAWAPLSDDDWKTAAVVLEQYAPAVRLQLLKNLWEVSHGSLWYDVENPARRYNDYDYEEEENWQDREDRLRWEEQAHIGRQLRTDPDTDPSNTLPLLLVPQGIDDPDQFLLDKWVIWRENFLTNCGPTANRYLWEGVDVEFDSQNRVVSWDLDTTESAELFFATDLSDLTKEQVDAYLGGRRYYGSEAFPGYLWALHPQFAGLDDNHPALRIQQDILYKSSGSDFVQNDFIDIVPKWVFGQLLSQDDVDFYDSALTSIMQKYPDLIYQVSNRHSAQAFYGVAQAMRNDPKVDASIDLDKLAPTFDVNLQWCARNASTTPKLRDFFLSLNDPSALAGLIESGSFEPTPSSGYLSVIYAPLRL